MSFRLETPIVPRFRTNPNDGRRWQPQRASFWNRHPRGVINVLRQFGEMRSGENDGKRRLLTIDRIEQFGVKQIRYDPIDGDIVLSTNRVSGGKIGDVLPAGSVTRDKMKPAALLPTVATADANKFLKVNSAGTGYEIGDR